MSQGPILIIAGTNRPDANALKIARIVEGFYRAASVQAEVYCLSEMPQEIFNPTSYASKPPSFIAVQNRVLAARGLHIVTPEYNGSFPGVLKYFIDMLKFPESFEGKPVAFVGEAAGIWGGLRPVEQLQHIFAYRNAHVFPDRVFIPGVMKVLDSSGQLSDAGLRERLSKQASGFDQFIQRIKA